MAALDRRLTKHALLDDRLKLVAKRNTLQAAINKFQGKAATYLSEAEEDPPDLPRAYTGDDWEDYAEDIDLTGELLVLDELEDEIRPEDIALLLPSSLGAAEVERLEQGHIAQQELQLREGQVNDALHRIRMTIGMKSITLRTGVRLAKHSQKKKTRAWREIQRLERTLTEDARIYTQARNAIRRLLLDDDTAKAVDNRLKANRQRMQKRGSGEHIGEDEANELSEFKQWKETIPELLRRFLPLEKEDLKAATHLLDHTERGTRQAELSWIWAVDVGGDTENAAWLDECRLFNRKAVISADGCTISSPKGQLVATAGEDGSLG